ncbi:hypothetical protein [Paracoccus sp. TOH]|uniref:hypothetical protein n=1 Tax=Paracoccus sp. TOH TaxID=1263728 RepID=UPI0025B1268C|nr:hypothetical protein [Paracoccus sp. TOH]WJS84440.1 hypothetical protein NBE95_01275 [Paracoccus sp. TOH]
MRSQDEPPADHTEADVTSETRFGPRPVPEGHRRPAAHHESRRIPPHGDVSPDGTRPWPHPSRGAKWLTWGGTTLAAAALTAGTVIAARRVIDLLSEDEPPRRRGSLAPRFAEMDQAEREAMRRRTLQREAEAAREAARIRAEAERGRPRPRRQPRQSLMQEVDANTASLAQGVESVMRSVSSAMAGFRSVAGQATTIMQEFGDAAALAQGIFGRQGREEADTPRPRHPQPDDRHGAHMPDLRDDPLLHDPMEGPEPEGPADHDPRTHRL